MLYGDIKYTIRDKNAVICKDFNNSFVNWSTLTRDREGTNLIMLTEETFPYQTVQKHTRGNDILDLVLTNDSVLIHTYEVGEPLTNSDHNIVSQVKSSYQNGRKCTSGI